MHPHHSVFSGAATALPMCKHTPCCLFGACACKLLAQHPTPHQDASERPLAAPSWTKRHLLALGACGCLTYAAHLQHAELVNQAFKLTRLERQRTPALSRKQPRHHAAETLENAPLTQGRRLAACCLPSCCPHPGVCDVRLVAEASHVSARGCVSIPLDHASS